MTPPTQDQREGVLSSLAIGIPLDKATCAERPTCVCGRHYEDAHDADTHDTRTLCDGRNVSLPVTWVDRDRAAYDLSRNVDRLRNYEIEDMLSKRIGGAWIVRGLCPFNGIHCSSQGNDAP